MERSIPLWVFLLCILLWLIATSAVSWAIKSKFEGDHQGGILEKSAIAIASFPDTAKDVLLELFSYLSGDYRDESIRVRREKEFDLSGFKPLQTKSPVDVSGLFVRAKQKELSSGWRVLIGAFEINGDIENAAFLISPDLKIVKTWILNEIPVGRLDPQPKYRKFLHGVEILRDGSLIFAFDNGISLQRFNSCGERDWSTAGAFHHAVTLANSNDSVWTFSGYDVIAKVSLKDGTILRQIPMEEIIAKNPMIDILEIRRRHSDDLGVNRRNSTGLWLADHFHLNDVEPLPSSIADTFESFNAGDLLVSARSLNLIFVLDPRTLEIKWWRVGAVQRQHDPDWLDSGEIMVLNNRMSRGFSEVVAIDPHTFKRRVMFDGRNNGFYTRIRGKHQRLNDGTLLVTSSQQGWAFEVNRNGDIVFEVVNLKPGSDSVNYTISELRWLPPDYFTPETWKCPTRN